MILSNGKEAIIDPASVVDGVGRVLWQDGRVLRGIYPHAVQHVKDLLNHKSIEDFFKAGLVRTRETTLTSEDFPFIIEHDRVDYKTLPYEWSGEMLRDALLSNLHLHKVLYKNGYALKDGNISNMLFDYTRPCFVDFGSVVRIHGLPNAGNYSPAEFPWEWSGGFLDQSYRFLKQSIDLGYLTYEDLVKLRNQNVENTLKLFDIFTDYFSKLELNYSNTQWAGYGGFSLDKEHNKYKLLQRVLAEEDAETIIDFGANKGRFSYLASDLGYKVVATDIDNRSLDILYRTAIDNNHFILPVKMDFTEPTEQIRGDASASDRLRSHGSMSIALIHHVAKKQGFTMSEFAHRVAEMSERFALVEFIDTGDPHIHWWSMPRWYSSDNLVHSMGVEGFSLVDKHVYEEMPTRSLLHFRRGDV